ncbi:MAG: GNAT family N-acetyltransferase [Bacteroidetes bacterium]|nr:GNAT family N-acetyltransferase [Bacteroidota bacterium]
MSTLIEYAIRPATLSHADSVARIYTDAILARDSTMLLEPVSALEIETKLNQLSDRETILVAVDLKETVLGWGTVKFYSDRPGYRLTCETSIFVDGSYRGQGVGTDLQIALLDFARKTGFHHVLVRIWAQNHSSISLHSKLGFTLVGIQKEIGHVDSKWIDVAVMQCLL